MNKNNFIISIIYISKNINKDWNKINLQKL